MFSDNLNVPEVINTFYKHPNSFATLELRFEEQTMLARKGSDKNELTRKGIFRLLIQKAPKDYNNSKLIFHITENPIGYFSFEPLYYSSQPKFKARILELEPLLIQNGFIEVYNADSIELTFMIKPINDSNSKPERVVLKYNNLISVKNHQDDSYVSGFNRIASIINNS